MSYTHKIYCQKYTVYIGDGIAQSLQWLGNVNPPPPHRPQVPISWRTTGSLPGHEMTGAWSWPLTSIWCQDKDWLQLSSTAPHSAGGQLYLYFITQVKKFVEITIVTPTIYTLEFWDKNICVFS
jgi:hypothetical protein